MKRPLIAFVTLAFLLSGCVTAAPTKDRGRSGDAQRTRADQAFDELEGRVPAPRTATTSSTRNAPAQPVPTASSPMPESFTKEAYLIARGYGQSKPEAIRRAKAELSNVFESRIESDISSVTRVVTESSSGASLSKTVQSKIRVASSVELQGVEVGEVTREDGEFVAVAALNRSQAAARWQQKMGGLDAKIAVEEQGATRASGKLMTLRHLNAAMGFFIEREALVSKLRVIGYSAPGAGEHAFQSLVGQLQKIQSNFKVALVVKSSNGDNLTRQLAKNLTEAGFLIGSKSSSSDAALRVTLALSKVVNNNPNFKFMRATADVSIVDPTTGETVGHFNESQRGAHLTYHEAGVKAVGKLSGALSKKVVAYFN